MALSFCRQQKQTKVESPTNDNTQWWHMAMASFPRQKTDERSKGSKEVSRLVLAVAESIVIQDVP